MIKDKLSREAELAIEAARKAGEEILKIYNQGFISKTKKDKAPVTEADIKSNEIILNILAQTGYPILSEEHPDDLKRLKHKKIWIIDPLDGTSDFVNKTGEFSVMIALVEGSKPILGLIYRPLDPELFIAQKDGSAYRVVNNNWEKLEVNNLNNLSKVKAVVSRHHLSKKERIIIDKFNISSFTQKGSLGLKVTEICQKKAELYFTITDKIKHWDTCAAYSIITEAGGKMTDMLGNDISYNTEIINHKNGILVTNGKIHDQIIEKYRKFIA